MESWEIKRLRTVVYQGYIFGQNPEIAKNEFSKFPMFSLKNFFNAKAVFFLGRKVSSIKIEA